MKLQFFRQYDWVWKGALPASGQAEKGSLPSVEALFSLKTGRPPWPAKLIVGVKAPVDPVTGFSVDMPTMDRRVGDLLRVLSFSLSSDVCPELAPLLKNMAGRLTEALRAESQSADLLEVLHFEIRLKNIRFVWREGVFETLTLVKTEAGWPEGNFEVAIEDRARLKAELRGENKVAENLGAMLALSSELNASVEFQEWSTGSKISVR